jgi:hypothetical protein
MGYLRGARRSLLIGCSALAIVVVAVLLAVLPALATTPGGAILPPSTNGVTPIDVNTGGQSNDCAVFKSQGFHQYRISNPKTGDYTTTVTPRNGGNNQSVTFSLKMNPTDQGTSTDKWPGYANDKYVSVSSTNAAIFDIGIKGGTDEAQYNYAGLPIGWAIRDGYLHAPAQSVSQSGTSLYSVSNLTFCFSLPSEVGAVQAPCPPSPFGTDPSTYQVELANCKSNQLYVFRSGADQGHRFVSSQVADVSQALLPLVEKIVWPYNPAGGQNQFKLFYTDIFPIDPTKTHAMQYCRLDPRDLVADPTGMTLKATYQSDANKGQVLPAVTADDPEASSCLISTTEATTVGGNGTYVAFIFSDIDSYRSN